MSELKIDEATPDTVVGGGELIPVSDAGTPKCMTVDQIKGYVLDKITALSAASAVSLNDDDVYILRGGALSRVTASTLATAIANEAFGRAGVADPNGNEVIAVKDSTTRKTLTLDALRTWLESNISITPDLTLNGTSAAGTLGDSDVTLVVQASAGKNVSLATLKDYIYGKFAAWLSKCSELASLNSDDEVLISHGGAIYRTTVKKLLASADIGVLPPSSYDVGNIPAWSGTANTLTNGYGVAETISEDAPSAKKLATEKAVAEAVSTVGDVQQDGEVAADALAQWSDNGKIKKGPTVTTSVGETGTDTAIPTEKAVRAAIEAVPGVQTSGLHTVGNIPTWGSDDTIDAGLSVGKFLRTEANVSHTTILTEKAVSDALAEYPKLPSSHVEDAIPQWGAGSELKAGKTVTTVLASSGSDEKIPTEKAVRDALPDIATTAVEGLMSAADKSKLDGLVNPSTLTEVGDNAPLGDNDVLTLLKDGTTWAKAFLTRFWAYVKDKMVDYRIDDLKEGEDNTDLDASTARHGLCPKLSGNDQHFLRGDGTFALPDGSTDFGGDSGTGGRHGLVPAPASGDAADGKFLKANGTWAVPPSAVGVDIPGAADLETPAGEDAFICHDNDKSAYCHITLAQIAEYINAQTRYATVFVPAAAMTPSASSGAETETLSFTNVRRDTVVFENDADRSCEFPLVMPEDWDGGKIRVKIYWTATDSTNAETDEQVKWVVGALSSPDAGSLSTAPTAFTEVLATLSQVNSLNRTAASTAFTPEGTIGAGNLLHFVVKRIVSSAPETPMDASAMLLGVVVQYARKVGVGEAWA